MRKLTRDCSASVKMWLDQFDGTAAKRSGESAFAWFDVVDNEPLPLCANEEAVIKVRALSILSSRLCP